MIVSRKCARKKRIALGQGQREASTRHTLTIANCFFPFLSVNGAISLALKHKRHKRHQDQEC